MKNNLMIAGLVIGFVAASSLFFITGCQKVSVPGPVISTLRLIDSSGVELSNGATTASRVLTVYGTLEDTSITTLEMTVNAAIMNVPVLGGIFYRKISLVKGLNTVIISVTNAAGGNTTSVLTATANIVSYGIWAQLTWDTVSDMDLHFNKSTGAIFDSTDCYFLEKAPDWDGTGSNTPGADLIDFPTNPVLDVDNMIEYGPENTVLQTPAAGQTYWVKVNAYSGVATPTVRIYINGVLAKTYIAPDLIISGGIQRVWSVCTIAWNGTTGTVTDVNTVGASSIQPAGHK